MEFFKQTDFDFLGKKWPFIILSLILTAAGLMSLYLKGGPIYGIDFKGGAVVHVKFLHEPPVSKLRSALSARIKGDISIVQVSGTNEVLIGTEIKDEKALNTNRQLIVETLQSTFGVTGGKLDLNNASEQTLTDRLREPLQKNGVSLNDQQLQNLAQAILRYRNTPPRSGLITNIGELSSVPGVTPAVLKTIEQECALGPFTIREVEMVGPKVGSELRTKAIEATLYALGGMLVYIAFRFEWIYGVAAVVAVFHDTIITIGLFSIFNKEINLTVIAALLTLVGYSMNDTIVVFDRIRENLKLLRREPLESLINKSVNQTLSRTVLTSGLTFLTALSLYLFGGQVLNSFSFALVVGIIVGTYSSIFIASPILIFWQSFIEKRKKRAPVPVVAPTREPGGKKVVGRR
ncbi:MAG TPA: protein translocase subunit SecF [Bryobacteraceae bacterium]|nr:protein translocase subunit SecF [Bryobacteraceae bacterium]